MISGFAKIPTKTSTPKSPTKPKVPAKATTPKPPAKPVDPLGSRTVDTSTNSLTLNPRATIDEQNKANQQTTQANIDNNRVGTESTYGSTNYSKNADGTYTLNSKLDPNSQKNFDNARDQQGNLLNQVGNQGQLNYNSLGKIPTSANDFIDQNNQTRNTIYDNANSKIQTQFGQDNDQLQQTLANRGIQPGNEQWNRSFKGLYDSRNQAQGDAFSNATTQGFNQAQGLFSNQLQGHQQGQKELDTLHNQGYQDLGQLRSYENSQKEPNATPFAQINQANTDVAGIVGGANNAQSNIIGNNQSTAASRYATSAGANSAKGNLALGQQYFDLNKANSDPVYQGANSYWGNQQQQARAPKKPGLGDTLASIGTNALGSYANSAAKSIGGS